MNPLSKILTAHAEEREKEFDKKFPKGIVVDIYPPETNGHRTVADISQDIKSFISSSDLSLAQKVERATIEETLESYTNWLLKKGYVDADVYAEEPTAIDGFLTSLTDKEI